MASGTIIKRYPTRQRKIVNYDIDIDSDEDFSESGDVQCGKSFFMELPGEVRNMIYEMALTDPSGAVCFDLDASSSDGSRPATAITRLSSTRDGSRPSSLSPNLLATSKRVWGEALGIIFGQPFVFMQPMALLLFLLSLRPGTSAELRDIVLQDYAGDRRRYLGCSVLLCDAVGLRRLSLCLFHRGDYHYTTDTALARDIADEFQELFSPFIRAFTPRHGTDALMDVVKFFDCGNRAHQDQVLGPVNNNQATTLDEYRFVARQCTGDREKSIVAEIEEIIADRLDRSWKT